jgi:hypothetical protein
MTYDEKKTITHKVMILQNHKYVIVDTELLTVMTISTELATPHHTYIILYLYIIFNKNRTNNYQLIQHLLKLVYELQLELSLQLYHRYVLLQS